MSSRNFASDNNAPVHPQILEAMQRANDGHVVAYGADPHTERALRKFEDVFGTGIETHFVFNGTGANVVGLSGMLESFQSVICGRTAHIQGDECGAPEKFLGCKLVDLPIDGEGKLTGDAILASLGGKGDQHHVQPRVLSITQSTELGTVYSLAEIQALSKLAKENGLLLHMDGARISNAAASLNLPLRAFTRDAGVDVLSFGGTKNGLMFGEAVVVFNESLQRNYVFRRKQAMQLASKMRYISAQFETLLTGDLWLENARHANAMAKLLESRVARIAGVRITRKTDSNAVFALVPKSAIPRIQSKYFFYVWDPLASATHAEVRWMTSFDTEPRDIEDFASAIEAALV